jgi:arsenite transporter
MGFFERYLTIWVLACIALGILLGGLAPQAFASLAAMEYARINLPVGLLIEVPFMLVVVHAVNRSKDWYERGLAPR